MKGNVLLVVAQQFRDKELVDTKEALQRNGFKCDIAAKDLHECVGADGLKIMPDKTLSESLDGISMYRAIAFIGGPGARAYFDDKEVHLLARTARDAGLLVGAVCIAPMILAKAGLLMHKKATAWDGDKQQSAYFGQNKINYTGEDVTVDDKIITGNGPAAATAFGERIAHLIK